MLSISFSALLSSDVINHAACLSANIHFIDDSESIVMKLSCQLFVDPLSFQQLILIIILIGKYTLY